MAKALILGATGGIGGAMAQALRGRGYSVFALHRSKTGLEGGISWIAGDAMNRRDVLNAAEDAEVIVHAVNPPQYRHWDKLVVPMIDNSIAAAKATGARILLPGTVYNYGPDTFPLLRETSPQNPKTRKGKIRVAMERHLQECGAKVLIVRAGDFFGPGAGNNWFAQVIVKAGAPVTRIVYPGARGVGHSWAYLPDLAETITRLLQFPLPDFARFHFQGHWDSDGTELIATVRRVTGAPDLKVSRFPWLATRLASPFVPMLREILEMRYLWQTPVKLDNTALMAVLGSEPHTAWDDAVRATLAANGNFA